MTTELQQALKSLRDALQAEAHPHCVAVEILVNSNGCEVSYRLRSPGSLNRDGISMRNLNGEWIFVQVSGAV